MQLEDRAVLLLKSFLVALFAILVVFQTLSMPGQFRHMAREDPELAPWRWPLTGAFVFWILCAQVVIVCTWKLLTMVREGRIFSDGAFGWVDGILAAIGSAWLGLVAVAGAVWLTADDPGLPFLLLLLTVGVAVVGLLMLVMRALLRQATDLRSDLETVI